MSVSNTTGRQLYDGDDSTLVFAIPFDIISDDSAEVDVYLVNATTRVATLQTEGVDYTLTDLDGDGEFFTNVTFVGAPTSSQKVLIIRTITLTQPLDIGESDDFPAESFETQLDRLTAQIQFLQEQINRSPKHLIGSTYTNPDLPEPNENYYLRWNAAGDLENSVGTGSVESLNDVSPTTTKGDLIGRSTSSHIRVPIGTNGQVLQADSTADAGVSWTSDINLVNLDFRTTTILHYSDCDSYDPGFEGWQESTSGSGAATRQLASGNAVEKHPGIYRCETGTTTSGRAAISRSYNGLKFGSAEYTWDALVKIPTLPTASEDFVVYVGMHQGIAGEPGNGVYFAIDRNESTTNWLAGRAIGASQTYNDTSTAFDTTWVWLRIIFNEDTDEALYYINGTLVYTATTGLPNNTVTGSSSCFFIQKSAGTTERTLDIDLSRATATFSTARTG